MNQAAPHYLLLTETRDVKAPIEHEFSDGRTRNTGGRWSFILEQMGRSNRMEASEFEPGIHGERLQLLAVIRGLEALEQPSSVTLVTNSDYVGRGIQRNLVTWRENQFHWERFGEMQPIKNRDLWMRIDVALNIHTVDCRLWQFDPHKISMSNQVPKTGQDIDHSTTTRIDGPHVAGPSIRKPFKSPNDASVFESNELPRVIGHQSRERRIIVDQRGDAACWHRTTGEIESPEVKRQLEHSIPVRFVGLKAACGVAG